MRNRQHRLGLMQVEESLKAMDVLLHTPSGNNNLSIHYDTAFKNAVELFVVAAYLTEWDSSLVLNPSCSTFRIIIGSDFGITRKAHVKR